jgi:hypothetical protein
MPIHSSQNLVIDSNIWIYLINCGLLDAAFRLGTLHVPDLMCMAEPLTEISWDDLQGKGVTFDELSSGSMRTLAEVKEATRGVSVCDVACLVLSEQMQIPLVTHDTDLYKLAVKRHVPVHNYDAFLELMVKEGIIDRDTQKTACETLVRPSRRPR